MITSKENCPYFSGEAREKWHRQRGIEDPLGKVVGEPMEDPAPYKPSTKSIEPPKSISPPAGPVTEEMTKEQRYRARNKEKLAAKARARRAKK